MKTEIIKVSETLDQCDLEVLRRASGIIKDGGLVIFPTETVYGLGADATNAQASSKIYRAKGRPSDNPLIIHISSPDDAEKYTYTSKLYYKLAEKFMPGPLTVVMKSKESVPSTTRGGLDTVAVRCPENIIARKLIELSGVPIAAPSANLSGSPSPTNARHAADDMMGRVDMIIDGGDCDFGLESTIVSITDESEIKLLRPGKITVDDLSEVGKVSIADAVLDKLREGEVAISPGMEYRHYAPKSPVVILDGEPLDCVNYIEKSKQNNIAVICYNDMTDIYSCLGKSATLYTIGDRDNLAAQAHNLFRLLREIDRENYSTIFAPLPTKEGIGLAIYNRLIRASAHTIINLRR